MNETQLISQLTAAIDERAATVGLPAGAAGRARNLAKRRQLRRRLAVSVSAAALAVGLVVADVTLQAPPGQSEPPGGHQVAQLTAAKVLDGAAASALGGRAVIPHPNQFVYWKTVSSIGGTAETWRSVNGSRNGFVLSGGKKVMLWGCRDGSQTVRPDPGSGRASITQRCLAEPAYLAGMPTKASEMRKYLTTTFGAHGRGALAKVSEILIDQYYLLPAQRAALYKIFVTLPGLKVVPHVRDYVGRPGVGVSVSADGFTVMWIFEPKTFAFLGSTELVDGKVSFASAAIKVAVVNKAGQRP